QRMFTQAVVSSTKDNVTSSPNAATLAKRVAAGAIQVVCDSGRPTLAFDPDVPVVAILLKPFETPIEPPEQPLGAELRARFRDANYVQLGPKADVAAYESARELARGAKQLVVAMAVRPAAWHAYGLRPQQIELVQ